MNEFLSADEQDFLQACEVGAIAIVKGLVRDGVNPNANHLKDEDGHSGLDYAGRYGHPELFKYLNELGGGSQSFEQERNAFKAMDGAIRNGHTEIVDYVVETYPNAEKWLFNDALWRASNSNQLEMAKKFIERGADVHDQDEAALRTASTYGKTEIVKYLVELGADVRASNSEALIGASENGYLETVNFLIEKGADVQAQDNKALIRAARDGHTDVVKTLLEHGANAQAQENDALYYAANYGYADMVKSLLEHGADPHAKNGQAILWAARNGHNEVIDVFLEKGVDIFKQDDCPIADAIYNNHTSVAENIITNHKIPLSEKSTKQLNELKNTTITYNKKEIKDGVEQTFRLNDKLLLEKKLESKLLSNDIASFSIDKPRQGLAKKMKSQGMKL